MQKKKVLAVVEDLLFTVKISDAAKRTGLEVEFLKSEKDVLEKALEKPLLIIMDLNCGCVQPIGLISKLKATPETKGISIIGFSVPYAWRIEAEGAGGGGEYGATARSAFSQNLQQILKRHAGVV